MENSVCACVKELKRLAKRYRSLKQDIAKLGASLQENPYQGADLGNGLRKVRMSITSKGKGKVTQYSVFSKSRLL